MTFLSNLVNINAEPKLRTKSELLAITLPKSQPIFEHSRAFVNSISSYKF